MLLPIGQCDGRRELYNITVPEKDALIQSALMLVNLLQDSMLLARKSWRLLSLRLLQGLRLCSSQCPYRSPVCLSLFADQAALTPRSSFFAPA